MKNYGEEQSSSQLKKTSFRDVDRPHPSQACIQYDKAISHIEPSREKEERATKKHLAP
ncbi:hypothetical protein DPMN_111324 [Dreissena polymorpha]|uniref:Uncharacterized protein n=1 Tax=Dreissena polymorpha TaxID=45954 RepID=A0A9D4KE27_DREPO|nr:hypothetical protein DPMN_111324 [Dreissena polymorpha]